MRRRTIRTTLAAAFVALVGAVALGASAEAVPVPYKNCGSPGDAISLSKVDASVWPPQRGQPETIQYAGNVARDVDVHKAVFDVTSTSGYHRKIRLRAQLIPAGPFTGSFTFTVPLRIQAGTVFNVHFTIVDHDENSALCADLTVPIK